ncbi:MAG: hypothetical protein WBN40_11120 [Pseudomonadales bacterium]
MSTQPATDQAAESRRKKRHELSKPIPVVDTLSGDAIGTLANITVGGMLIVGNKPMDANRIYQIELQFPGEVAEVTSVCVGIDCLWVNQEQGMAWSGCEIIDADDDAIAIIEQLIIEYSTDS